MKQHTIQILKNCFSVLCILLLVLSLLSGCTPSASLHDHGSEIIGQLVQLQSPEKSLSALYNTELKKSEGFSAFKESQYDTPQAIYELRFTDQMHLVFDLSKEELEETPALLKEEIQSNIFFNAISKITAKMAPSELIVSTILEVSSYFVDSSVTEDKFYLYVFASGLPIFVSFNPKNDGIVIASARPIFWKDFDTSSEESIEKFFHDSLGFTDFCTVSKVS